MKNCFRKWCLKLCIFFPGTFAFGEIWLSFRNIFERNERGLKPKAISKIVYYNICWHKWLLWLYRISMIGHFVNVRHYCHIPSLVGVIMPLLTFTIERLTRCQLILINSTRTQAFGPSELAPDPLCSIIIQIRKEITKTKFEVYWLVIWSKIQTFSKVMNPDESGSIHCRWG